MKKRIAFLASGGGSNVEAILQAMQDQNYPAKPVVVLTNQPMAGVLTKAKHYRVPTIVVDNKNFANREDFDIAIVAELQKTKPDFVVLAGYMRIVTSVFLQSFDGRVLNIHPSLLPKYGGLGMYGRHVHEAVLKSKDKESGATVHWASENVDEGAIILQERVPVLLDDSVDSLAARVLVAEHRVYPEALRRICLDVKYS